MPYSLLIFVGLLLVTPSWGAGVGARHALANDGPMNWAPYEVSGIDTLATAKRLGICIVENLYTSEHFRSVDIDGNRRPDLICEGPKVDCEHAWEGWETKLFLVRDDIARLVFQQNGSIRSIWRDSLDSPISFILRDPGCCADTRVFYRFYHGRKNESNLEFKMTRDLMRAHRIEFPASYFEEPEFITVASGPIQLRGTSEIVDHGRFFPLDDEVGTGNIVAKFPQGTRVEVLGAIDRRAGEWRLVAAPLSKATWLLQTPDWAAPDNFTTEVLGWVRLDDLK